jgi:hypothetical protein
VWAGSCSAFWNANVWGLTKMSSRQDEGSTMNCSDSKGRCRGVVVFVSDVGRGEGRGNNLLASTPCAYQQGFSNTLSSDPTGAYTAHSCRFLSPLLDWTSSLGHWPAALHTKNIFLLFDISDAPSPLNQSAHSTTNTKPYTRYVES